MPTEKPSNHTNEVVNNLMKAIEALHPIIEQYVIRIEAQGMTPDEQAVFLAAIDQSGKALETAQRHLQHIATTKEDSCSIGPITPSATGG